MSDLLRDIAALIEFVKSYESETFSASESQLTATEATDLTGCLINRMLDRRDFVGSDLSELLETIRGGQVDTGKAAALQQSIFALFDEILGDDDFEVGNEYAYDIYLDPKQVQVYKFHSNNSHPIPAHHGVDLRILRVREGAILASVKAAMLSVVPHLVQILDGWCGTSGAGDSYRGNWRQDSLELLEAIQEERIGIAYHYNWEPEPWFESVRKGVKVLWHQGRSAQEVVDYYGGRGGEGERSRQLIEAHFETWSHEREKPEAVFTAND